MGILLETTLFKGATLLAPEPIILFKPQAEIFPPQSEISEVKTRLESLFPYAFYGLDDRTYSEASVQIRLTILLTTFAKNLLNKHRGAIKYSGLVKDSRGELPNDLISFYLGYHEARLTIRTVKFCIQVIKIAAFLGFDGKNSRDQGLECLPSDIRQEYKTIQELSINCHPDFQAKILIEGSRVLRVPFGRSLFSDFTTRSWRYGSGIQSENYFESASFSDGRIPHKIVNNKSATRKLIECLGFPAPRQILVRSYDELKQAWNQLGYNIVVKPIDSGKGNGVTVLPKSQERLRFAFDQARNYSNIVLLEEFIEGHEHRFLVVDGEVVGVARRMPAFVVGDGISSIKALIVSLNNELLVNPWTRQIRIPISLDDIEMLSTLEALGYTLDTVLPKSAKVYIRRNSNVSTGGHCQDVTDETHEDNIKMIESIAAQLNIHALGFDFLTPDISLSWKEVKSSIIEVNSDPGLFIHCSSDVKSQEIIGAKVLERQVGLIPIIVIAGSSGYREVLRNLLLSHLDFVTDVGFHFGDEIMVGSQVVSLKGEAWDGFDMLLGNKLCKAVVSLIQPDLYLEFGLPFHRCCLGVMDPSLSSSEGAQVEQLFRKYCREFLKLDASFSSSRAIMTRITVSLDA